MGGVVTDEMQRLEISVHSETNDPDSVWEQYQNEGRKCLPFEPLPLDTPVDNYKVRFVCISDTHSQLNKVVVPPGDVLLHAGDFTFMGRDSETRRFNQDMGDLPHTHKVVIAGNHELSFKTKLDEEGDPRALLTNCTYLEDSAIEVKIFENSVLGFLCFHVFGYRIYGSPWAPTHKWWAFDLPRGEALLEKWNMIPTSVDVLVTHGPPLGHGDYAKFGRHVGCVELLDSVEKRIKPKYHIFGHIHKAYGCTTNGETVFVNASICTGTYRPKNNPVIFDLPLKEGQRKL